MPRMDVPKASAQSTSASPLVGRQCGAEVVVPFPQTDYGSRIIDLLWRQYGIRSIAVSRSWRDRLVLEHRFPVLSSEAVAASYVLGTRSIEDLLVTLRRRHHVRAVVPHHEETVLDMSRVAAGLDLSWAQPDVLPLFRDKPALKARIRERAPRLRLNKSARVYDAGHARELVRHWGLDRFVIKPIDGGGNSRVGFFDSQSSEDEIRMHLQSVGGPAVLEEHIDGHEYFVNGQVDHLGSVMIHSVQRYVAAPINGKPNVTVGAFSLGRGDALYAVLASYARAVMRASGLRRSPFHLEAKVDHAGPCLIEVAARFVGMGTAPLDKVLSGVDPFALALHYYLHDTPYPHQPSLAPRPEPRVAHVLGVSQDNGRIAGLTGVVEAEQLPGFFGWARRPVEGLRVRPTVDLDSTPWAAHLVAGDARTLHDSAEQMRELVRWRTTDPALREWPRTLLARVWRSRPRTSLLSTRRLSPASPRGLGPRRRAASYAAVAGRKLRTGVEDFGQEVRASRGSAEGPS